MGYVVQNFKNNQILKADHLNHIEDGLVSILGTTKTLTKNDFVNGSYSLSNLTTTETNRIRTGLISVKSGDICSFALDEGWTGYIAWQANPTDTFTVATGWAQTIEYKFTQNCDFIIVLRKDSNEDITPENYASNIIITSSPTVALGGGGDSIENQAKEYFLEEIELTKASVKECLTEPCLVFPMLSDIHYMVSPQKPTSVDDCANNILALSKDLEFDFIACLGDITEGDKAQATTQGYNDYILAQFKKIGVPYYQCVGNHDDNRYNSTFTHQQLYRNFIRNTKDVVFDNKTTMCGTNFYKDFNELGLRCIFLNANTNGSYGYSSDTCDWFENVVNASENRFIVFTHMSPVPEHNYGKKYGTDDGSTRIRTICENSDKFIILFSGHNHYDASFTEPFLSFTMNCQKFENENGSPSQWAIGAVKPTRTLGDATEDCFDIVIVRPISKKINRIRFGAGDDQEYIYE